MPCVTRLGPAKRVDPLETVYMRKSWLAPRVTPLPEPGFQFQGGEGASGPRINFSLYEQGLKPSGQVDASLQNQNLRTDLRQGGQTDSQVHSQVHPSRKRL